MPLLLLFHTFCYCAVALLVFGVPFYLLVRRFGWNVVLMGHLLITVAIIALDVIWINIEVSKLGWDGTPDMDAVFVFGVLMRVLLIHPLLLPVDILALRAWRRHSDKQNPKRSPPPDWPPATRMDIRYLELIRPYRFSSPFAGQEFAALLYAADDRISEQEQADISAALVAQGCRYAVCAGHQCSSWDDSIDFAYAEHNDWQCNDENFVMTTWHDDESLEDIVFFFLCNTSFDYFYPEKSLVLVIGNAPDMLSEIKTEIEKQGIPNHRTHQPRDDARDP